MSMCGLNFVKNHYKIELNFLFTYEIYKEATGNFRLMDRLIQSSLRLFARVLSTQSTRR